MDIPEELVGVISYCEICKRRDFNHQHEED
jgi:hypothetical protein